MSDPNPDSTAAVPPNKPLNDQSGTASNNSWKWSTIIQYTLFAALAAAALYVIYWAISGRTGFVGSLTDQNTARGLITFLIAFTTVSLAVILVLASIISSGNSNDLKMRFEQGREIFTTLIGILGTIVGFYFGSTQGATTTTPPQQQQQQQGAPGAATPVPTPTPAAVQTSAQFASARVSKPNPKAGETVTIISFIGTGTPPYTYSITFEPGVIPAVRDATSQDGLIRQDVPIPPGVATGTPVNFRIDVNDSQGQTVSYNGAATQKLRIASQ